MSQENVEVVRRAFDALASASYDPRRVADFFKFVDPEVEYDISRTNPETAVYRGRDGVSKALQQWLDTWDDYEAEAQEFIDAGPDRVVTVIRERGKLKGSDAWVEHTRGAVWAVRDHRIVRYEEHQDRSRALQAAGLEE
jgi:ketosteroid isomerase-like protein